MHRVYLDELGTIESLPLGIAAMVLTIVEDAIAPEKARMLIGRATQEVASLTARQGIIEMISTIMVYRFTRLSRQEIDEMLGTKLEETRVYQEAQEDKARSIALKMLQKKVPLETITEFTELTIEQLHQLQSQIPPS
jgi:predicted transposase YdaD